MGRFTVTVPFYNTETGRAYPFSRLFFFINNTSTPKDTFADFGETVVNPNPVVSDGSGQFGNIFLDNEPYSVEFRDRNNVTIWRRDDVRGQGTLVPSDIIIEERQTLTDGQTLVNWSDINANLAAFYVSNADVDQGRLTEGSDEDYTINSATSITLNESYPNGTTILALQFEPTTQKSVSLNDLSDVEITNPQDGDILVYNDLMALWVNSPGTNGGDMLDFDSVADAKAAGVALNSLVRTKSYYNNSASDTEGAAFYRSMTAAEFGGTPDEKGDHTDTNGNVLKLIVFFTATVKQYGAVGDGVTDDTSCFDAAIAAQERVYIPASDNFYMVANVEVLSNKEIFGPGDAAKLMLIPGDYGDTATTPAAALKMVNTDATLVHGFLIDGNKDNVTGNALTNIEGIDLNSATNCKLYDLTLNNTKADGIDFDESSDCQAFRIKGTNCGGYAVHISINSTRCKTYNCLAVNCGDDLLRGGFDVFSSASQSEVFDNVARNCYRGFVILGDDNICHSNRVITATDNGIRIEGNRNQVQNNRVQGAVSNIRVVGNDNIINNNHSNSGDVGISVEGARNTIAGNLCRDNAIQGIRLTAPSNQNVITGNISIDSNNAGSGIVDTTSNQNYYGENFTGGVTPVGYKALLEKTTANGASVGDVIAGSNFVYANTSGSSSGAVPDGDWYLLGQTSGTAQPEENRVSLYIRVGNSS